MHSLAVYDFIVDLLRGRPTSVARRRAAMAAPVRVWERVMELEGCGERIDRALTRSALLSEVPPRLRRMLRDTTGAALRAAVLANGALIKVAAVAAAHDVRVIALKGAARLLGGEVAGTRSMTDIDLLIPSSDAPRFHALLQHALGYRSNGRAYPHHLPALTRTGTLGIEIHCRLSDAVLALDSEIVRDTRVVMLQAHPIEIPSPTNMVLHTLEHAAGLNWMVHYRLRDVIDVASLFTTGASADAVRSYVRASSSRIAFETLLSAAHELQPMVPTTRPEAWRTMRRIARTRLALAVLPHERTTANRVFRYASLLAEGSPRSIARAAGSVLRRAGAIVLPTAAFFIGACSDATRSPSPDVPPFVFVSDTDGVAGLHLFDHGIIARLSKAGDEDDEPHSAAGRIVFVSRRDGNAEIYIGDLNLAGQQRLTDNSSNDREPALDPSGTTVAFVSSRSGAPRIWLMDATGANPRPLDTGSPSFTPEGAPVWSPAGDRIAFTSTRTNTAQIFILKTSAGQAEQLTHEASGAFTPAWSADGRSILYAVAAGQPRIMIIPASGGDAVLFASGDRPLGEPACAANVCLVVAGTSDADRDIIAVKERHVAATLLDRAADDRRPAFLVP